MKHLIEGMRRCQLVKILDRYGLACLSWESTNSIREALLANVDDGTIPVWELSVPEDDDVA